ncbi:Citramalyl-CoA lyase mitochondrial [Dissostichus eleginoides]|uniref:Citramalyl-CoA lyase mitochondrial n=1 Tax=Dissostichus eleginoides TaxID=100907 RepID=A0AAD9CLP7_DISEL|nr:Citramalyl-CoA lyase mitochondrial [Dissostichus eleginoides]
MVPVTLTDGITKRKGALGREGRAGLRMGRGLYVSPARALMGRGLAAGYHCYILRLPPFFYVEGKESLQTSLGITAEALHKSIVCRFVSWEKAGDFEKDYRERGWLLPTAWQNTEAGRYHHHSAGSSLRYIPRRAVLYCPGNDERKLRKLASLDVDCAVLDCEDGVALSKKVSIGDLREGMIGEREVRVRRRVMTVL